MAIRIVRLGTPRARREGVRIGTVRRPPRGVARADFAAQDWYDVWYPELSPTPATLALGLAAKSPRDWAAFRRRFRTEMGAPAPRRTLDVLAALSHDANFSLGCYCADETRCHRSVLRALLAQRGARLA
jgi:uncharacterized protein YeaO (DUF488 family)